MFAKHNDRRNLNQEERLQSSGMESTIHVAHRLGNDVIIHSGGDRHSGTWRAAMNLHLRTLPDRGVPDLDNWTGALGHVK